MLQQILDLLGSEAASNVIIGLIAIVAGLLVKMSFSKKHKLDRCILAFQTAVQEVYESYVKALKEAATDGKLTDAEKQQARDRAYSQAKDILAEEGIDLAKFYGPRIAKAIIEALVKKSKTAGKMAKEILPKGTP